MSEFNGTPPAAGAGAHIQIAGSGWKALWNGYVPMTQAALVAGLKCDPVAQTWTDTAGANESYAMTCMNWYQAFMFCAWDGGFLPTEAEWEYAAAGGADNRLYPWGSGDPSLPANKAFARDSYDGNLYTGARDPVGAHPLGVAKWGQQDMAGGVLELVLDFYDPNWYLTTQSGCNDCANFVPNAYDDRVMRGGSWIDTKENLRAALRVSHGPSGIDSTIGFRCARKTL